jgi:hypothetical protein
MNENTVVIGSDSISDKEDTRVGRIFESRLKLTATLLSQTRNITVVNYSNKDIYNILKLLLSRLSLLDTISDYSKDIIVDIRMADACNKLFIDCPHIYFTGISKVENTDSSISISIHIQNKDPNKNIMINVYNDYSKVGNVTRDVLIIHKRDSSLKNQNKFFYNVVNTLVKCRHREYIRLLNSETSDIEYVIIKNGKLLYM